MNKEYIIENCMKEAIANRDNYIFQTSGIRPEQKEIANALSKYFVLKEILDFVLLERQEN
ncbi:MAG: hypothetical protein GY699_20775 [Desulfobacteraceae bacterium]|nr:hypothetical protein [Desulfobacteraceae bacterium]